MAAVTRAGEASTHVHVHVYDVCACKACHRIQTITSKQPDVNHTSAYVCQILLRGSSTIDSPRGGLRRPSTLPAPLRAEATVFGRGREPQKAFYRGSPAGSLQQTRRGRHRARRCHRTAIQADIIRPTNSSCITSSDGRGAKRREARKGCYNVTRDCSAT